MKQQNINNLTSLWLLASEPFNTYKKVEGFHVIDIDFSEWPNRIWRDTENENLQTDNPKIVLRQFPTKLTFTDWISLQGDEHRKAEDLGLTLKSIQIGMSLNLRHYDSPSLSSSLFLNRVDNTQKAVLWSKVFQQCFNYSISQKIIDKIKNKVTFYLIIDNLNIVGCVATFIKDNQIGIHSLGILHNYRKQGYAEAVMRRLLHEAKSNNIENAHLQSSILGLNIYKKIGFKQIFKMCNYKI